MKKTWISWALAAALSVGASVALAAQAPLLNPVQTQALLAKSGVRVIDIRDAKSYAAGHVPGALHAPYGQWRGPASNPGDLAPLDALTALVQSLGLTPETSVVLVSSGADSTDFGATARVYWTLKVLGAKNLSILNGGVQAWTQASLPLETQAVKVTASSWKPAVNESLVVRKEEVLQHIQRQDAQLVDGRPAEFFLGDTRHVAAKVPGTIAGAVNFDNARWFVKEQGGRIDTEAVKALASTYPTQRNQSAVSFCNTGHWAATNWFVASELLGQTETKLYPGSMVEWTQDASLPMTHVPSRLAQLLIDAKLKASAK